MHDYSKPTAPIDCIYFFLVLLSIIISMAISYYLRHLSANNFKGYLILIFAGTPLTIYGVLFWSFDRFLWKVPFINDLIKIPNLKGDYEGILESSYSKFESPKKFSLKIEQTFRKIIIIFKTESSESKSMSAFLKKEGDTALLIYNYQNEPTAVEKATLTEHKGTAWLKFNLKKNTFEGKYYTDKRPLDTNEAISNYGKLEGSKKI